MDNNMILQKYLAAAGIASRRAAERMIGAGRVAVNGATVARQGVTVTPGRDVVTLDGAVVPPPERRRRAILFHKPRGYVCSTASSEGRTIYECLRDIPERLAYAGRLDRDSEGLLLLSNDGDLILRATHPRFGHEKTYRVTVSGPLTAATLAALRAPTRIGTAFAAPAQVTVLKAGANAGRMILRIVLTEGRNRQIRVMCEQQGLTVHRLVRTAIGELTLRGLRPGAWRDLLPQEIERLRHPPKPRPATDENFS